MDEIAYSLTIFSKETLQVLSHDRSVAMIEQLRKECKGARRALDEVGGTQVETSWDDEDWEMNTFSKQHPEFVFQLDWQDEGDRDNFGRDWFWNGQKQVAQGEMVIPEYSNKFWK